MIQILFAHHQRCLYHNHNVEWGTRNVWKYHWVYYNRNTFSKWNHQYFGHVPGELSWLRQCCYPRVLHIFLSIHFLLRLVLAPIWYYIHMVCIEDSCSRLVLRSLCLWRTCIPGSCIFHLNYQKIPIFLHYHDHMLPYFQCNSTIKFYVLMKFLAMFLIIECD